MMSSSATTAAVTARSVTLAPENESAMSAPNAGPPVTSARSASGRPSSAAARTFSTSSVRAKPDRSASSGTVASAACPSSDTWVGGPGGAVAPAADNMRWRACSASCTSFRSSGAPSVRVTTRITGASSPPGNASRAALARADSALSGTGTGDCSAELLPPSSPSTAPEDSTMTRAISQESRRLMRDNISDN